MRQGWGCPLPAGHCGEAGRLRHAAGSAHCGRAGEALTSPRSLAHRSRELQHAETTLAVVAAGLAVGLGTGMVGRGHRTPVSPFPRPPPWHAALGWQKPSPCPFSDVSYPCALSRGGGGLLSLLGSAYLGPLNPASLVIWLGEERYLEREEGLHMFICMLGGFSSPPACRCLALRTAEPKYCAPHQSPRNPADKYLRGGWWSKRCPGKRLLLHLEGPRSRLARPAWHGRQARSGQEPWHGLPSRLVPSASHRSQRRGW